MQNDCIIVLGRGSQKSSPPWEILSREAFFEHRNFLRPAKLSLNTEAFFDLRSFSEAGSVGVSGAGGGGWVEKRANDARHTTQGFSVSGFQGFISSF